MEGIKYIFIDIDNTILDFDACVKEGISAGFKKHSLGVFDEEKYRIFHEENNKLWKQLEKGEITFQELKRVRFNIVFARLGIQFDGVLFESEFRTFIHEFAIPVDGAYELLEKLSKKYILCAASNGPYEQQVHRLEVAKMRKYFSYLFISENLGVQKPDPLFFEKAFSLIGNVQPSECLIIGDSLTSDIQGGKNIGMKTIHFNKNHLPNQGVIIPDYVYDTLSEISEML